MKLSAGLIAALYAFQGTTGFNIGSPKAVSAPRNFAGRMSVIRRAAGWDIKQISPDGGLIQRVEGKTRKTWKFNDLSRDRVQVALESEGRPVTADIQLWLGPDWTPFSLKAYSEDGKARPIQTLVGTRNKAAMIEVKNNGDAQFPFKAASNYAEGAMTSIPAEIPGTTPGERVDGGAIRSYPVDPLTEQLEVCLLYTSPSPRD